MSRSTRGCRTACYETEARLTEARKQLAELNVEVERTRGRLEVSGQAERGHRAADRRRARPNRKNSDAADRPARGASCDPHTADGQPSWNADRRPRASAASKRTRRARFCKRASARAGEEPRSGAACVVLRLLGESSTLKNQLAQMDEYLAGIERESTRVHEEEQIAPRRSGAAVRVAKEDVSQALAQRQLELESVTGERAPHAKRSLGAQATTRARARQTIDALRDEAGRAQSAQGFARRDSVAPRLYHRIREATVRRDLKKASRRLSARWACWPISSKWIPAYEKRRRRISARRAGVRGGARIGSRPSAAST